MHPLAAWEESKRNKFRKHSGLGPLNLKANIRK